MTTSQADLSSSNLVATSSSNGTAALTPLWQRFDAIAGMYPERTAVTCGEVRVSYSELQGRAERLAAELRGMGVGPDCPVGVFLERSADAVVALLAVLKAGGAYLPLDPAYPPQRVAMIVEDACPPVVITSKSLLGSVPQGAAKLLCIDEPRPAAEMDAQARRFDAAVVMDAAAGNSHASAASDAAVDAGLENLAYIIYTSGSTGKPKGVMVTHANVARLLTATDDWFHFNEQDVWTFFHSYAFDFSVWEIWGCLLYGGRLVVVPFAVSRSPQDFYELLVRERVTVLNQTPSAFYQLIAVDQERRSEDLSLRVVVFGGEALNFSALRPWFVRHGDTRPRLINMYGITETTVHVTYRELSLQDAEQGSRSLIGVPIPDLQLHVLREDLQPAPVGEVGEIYVGGAGVARGYLNRPELNAERFIPDRFSGVAGARLYKSGDLARYLEDGELEYLGRGDAQVKIQGFRIELGEIEAALTEHPKLREVRVIAHTDETGTKRLVAYYVSRSGEPVAASELSESISAKLPPWMMPSFYMPVEAFPLTANGKVDTAALPQPRTGSDGLNLSANSTDIEKMIAAVWREVLHAEHVGLEDNFFDIGGTSLLLVSVHTKLQTALERKIPITDLFSCTSIRSLAHQLGGTKAEDAGWKAVQAQAEKRRAAFARVRGMQRNGR